MFLSLLYSSFHSAVHLFYIFLFPPLIFRARYHLIYSRVPALPSSCTRFSQYSLSLHYSVFLRVGVLLSSIIPCFPLPIFCFHRLTDLSRLFMFYSLLCIVVFSPLFCVMFSQIIIVVFIFSPLYEFPVPLFAAQSFPASSLALSLLSDIFLHFSDCFSFPSYILCYSASRAFLLLSCCHPLRVSIFFF